VSTVFAGSGQTLSDVLSPLAAKLQSGLDFFDVVLANSEEVSLTLYSDASVLPVDLKTLNTQVLQAVSAPKTASYLLDVS
jgi:hypothetical protein